MTTYTTLTDAQLAQDQPQTQAKMRALRDNPLAIAEGDASAPKIQTAAIADSAITSVKIANNTIAVSKLISPTASYTGVVARRLSGQADTVTGGSFSTTTAYLYQTAKNVQSWTATQTGTYRIRVIAVGGSPSFQLYKNGVAVSTGTQWDIAVTKADHLQVQLIGLSGTTTRWSNMDIFGTNDVIGG